MCNSNHAYLWRLCDHSASIRKAGSWPCSGFLRHRTPLFGALGERTRPTSPTCLPQIGTANQNGTARGEKEQWGDRWRELLATACSSLFHDANPWVLFFCLFKWFCQLSQSRLSCFEQRHPTQGAASPVSTGQLEPLIRKGGAKTITRCSLMY